MANERDRQYLTYVLAVCKQCEQTSAWEVEEPLAQNVDKMLSEVARYVGISYNSSDSDSSSSTSSNNSNSNGSRCY